MISSANYRVLSSGFPSVLAKACARWGGPSLGHPIILYILLFFIFPAIYFTPKNLIFYDFVF